MVRSCMKISVITINYNNADGLKKTIESVICQSYNDYEFIIIDGGSIDNSQDIILQYQNQITYWVSEPDKGIYNAMNKGISKATGDYCIFMNSGDCFYDSEVIYNFITLNLNEDIVVGNIFSSKSNKVLFSKPQREISLYYLYSSTIPHQGSFIKTSLQKKHLYDESLKIVADWKFFVQAIILDNCSYKYIDIPIGKFDTEGLSTTHREATWLEKQKVLYDIFPTRVLEDCKWLKAIECKTQVLLPQLRNCYGLDKLLFQIAKMLLKVNKLLK